MQHGTIGHYCKIPASESRDVNRPLTAGRRVSVVYDDLSLRSIGSNDRFGAKLNDRRIRSHVPSPVDYRVAAATHSCRASSERVYATRALAASVRDRPSAISGE